MSGNYKYYDYLKKYDAAFLNKYESWFHYSWGRKTNFNQLLKYKAYLMWTGGRTIFIDGTKLKTSYAYLAGLICIADIWGVWFFQEMYNKYQPWKWIYYQPYYKEECKSME